MSAVLQTMAEELISYNPATCEELGRARISTPEDVKAAVERSREVFRMWKTTSFAERKRLVMRAREVILAEVDGKMILIDQPRVPIGKRCLELPAGLVGDEDEAATVEETAIKELEEETGYTAEHIEVLGEFYSSPGMVAESFTLVSATGVRKIGDGGGNESEEINVHLVARADITDFVAKMRAKGFGIDTKLLLFLNS
jgi:ADP-ribose pyrophosphatase